VRAFDGAASMSPARPRPGLLSASDEEQLRYAVAQSRVIFTQDRDFLRLHAAGTHHAGMAYCAKDAKSIGEIIQRLVLIWEVLEPAEMTNHVEYL
jgi:hypothetical protein